MAKKRQLTDKEKEDILDIHGRVCFIDGAPIPDEESIEFHHIRPYSKDGPTTKDNEAPVCKAHHRRIGTMSLQEFRDRLDLEAFFGEGSVRYLDDLIQHKIRKSGERLTYKVEDNHILLYLKDSENSFPLYACLTTGWKYFYAAIPVEFIGNDKDLQPRALRVSSLWNLYRHFQTNTQLAPSICRITDDRHLLLFDGQHKAAAQIWSGRSMIECKVYLLPDARDLKETNLEAHGKFRQMSFYSHELMKKYADLFGEDWAEYMDTEGEKSELGFFNFLIASKGKTKAQARNEISLAMYNEIIDDPINKLSGFLPEKNRTRKQPITFARLKKTMLKNMLLAPPVEDEFETDFDFRKEERRNFVRLMNIIADEGLISKWDPERNDHTHKKAERIFNAGSVRAWTVLLKDAINQHLRHYTDEERERFFYRRISDSEFSYFRNFVKKLFSHKLWDEPDPTGELTARLARDDATTTKTLFDEKDLTVHWLLSGD